MSGVNVMAILDDELETRRSACEDSESYVIYFRTARDAVANLIAADHEYDKAVQALEEAYRLGHVAALQKSMRELCDAFVGAEIRRRNALDAIGGAS